MAYLDGPSGARQIVQLATPPGVNGSVWDGAKWDQATWAGEIAPAQVVMGCIGIGQDVAIIIRGTATSRTSFVGVDVFYELAEAFL